VADKGASANTPLLINVEGRFGSSRSKTEPVAIESGLVKDVALKIISKRKVKGNEASVWEEMEVLKGLNHSNIVRAVS
jgi:calcium/calmodulin-dependent protein kinase I